MVEYIIEYLVPSTSNSGWEEVEADSSNEAQAQFLFEINQRHPEVLIKILSVKLAKNISYTVRAPEKS